MTCALARSMVSSSRLLHSHDDDIPDRDPYKESGNISMNKVSAIAFIIVLLFVGIAGYLVYSNLRNDLPTIELTIPGNEPSPTAVIVAETVITQPEMADTETPAPANTTEPTQPAPSSTVTVVPVTSTATPSAGSTIQVVTPTSFPTRTPRAETLTVTATPTIDILTLPTGVAATTPQPAGSYVFYLDGEVIHDQESSCVAQYIRGMVRNKAGDPLEGVRIKAFDLWGNEIMAISKGGTDIGKWDIVLGGTENIWKVVILDAAGVEISPIARVPHHQDDEFNSACVHIVNWRRSW